MKERRVTDGARALRAYLRDRGQSVPSFCEEHRLDRIAVQRALNGERQRVSVDLATLIEQATGGVVRVQLWTSWTGRVEEKPSRNGTDG